MHESAHTVKAHVVLPVWPQCFARHDRPEIGTTDTNIDNISQPLPRTAFDVAALNCVDEVLHFGQDCPNLSNARCLERNLVRDF